MFSSLGAVICRFVLFVFWAALLFRCFVVSIFLVLVCFGSQPGASCFFNGVWWVELG